MHRNRIDQPDSTLINDMDLISTNISSSSAIVLGPHTYVDDIITRNSRLFASFHRPWSLGVPALKLLLLASNARKPIYSASTQLPCCQAGICITQHDKVFYPTANSGMPRRLCVTNSPQGGSVPILFLVGKPTLTSYTRLKASLII